MLFAIILTSAFFYFFHILIGRLLGIAEYGEFGALFSLSFFLQFILFKAVTVTVARSVSKFKGKNNNDPLIVRFLRANNIKNPINDKDLNPGENVTFGIGTNPNDIEDVKTYYYCGSNGKVEKIPAEEMIHIKILTDSDVKRGISFLLVSMGMIRKYSEWLDDRVVLNQVRSAIALIKNIEGNASTVESLRSAQQTEHKDTDRNRQKAMRRGTVITASKGIKYEMLSPKINAPDVKDDGRAMLLAVAAGSGMPEMVVTADYSNANYSSSMVAQNPFVREIEDWQDFFKVYDKILFAEVMRNAKDNGPIPENESEECIVEYPPLILADIKKNNEAREIQHRNKILSKKTWQEKEGLDPDVEENNMEEEQTKDIYKVPFNMPLAPVNQFGSVEGENIEE